MVLTATATMKPEPRGLYIVEPPGPSYAYLADRTSAGQMLAEFLNGYRGFDTLVLGLPRGGVEVADALARRLGADLDVFVSRKIRTPGQPELAAGAIAEGGAALWNHDVVSLLALSDADWQRELDRSRAELEARVRAYRLVLPRARVAGRPVIIVDDGVATGATLRAAVAAVAALRPASIVVALPGGSRESLEELAHLDGVDEVVALLAPEPFYAVAQLYRTFPQVSDTTVLHILRRANERRLHHAAAHEPLR